MSIAPLVSMLQRGWCRFSLQMHPFQVWAFTFCSSVVPVLVTCLQVPVEPHKNFWQEFRYKFQYSIVRSYWWLFVGKRWCSVGGWRLLCSIAIFYTELGSYSTIRHKRLSSSRRTGGTVGSMAWVCTTCHVAQTKPHRKWCRWVKLASTECA